MKLQSSTVLLLAALALPLGAGAQDRPEGEPYEVYPAEPVGPGGGDYDVSVDLEGGPSVSFSTFEEPLAGYGDWVPAGAYGTVWRPRVPAGWRPYYYGRWEWTTEGWLWVSDEPFGWATYHYGRWTHDRGLGWLWVPGYQWAPAWVSWRYSGDVVGWAPLAPGLSLYVTNFAFVDFWWTFVPTGRFCGARVHGIAYAPGHARRWYDATRPAPPRPAPRGSVRPGPGRAAPPAWGGPASRFVEERSGRPIRPARIVPSAAPGSDRGRPGEIGVYRPEARPRHPARGGRDDGRGPGVRPPAGPERSRERDGRERAIEPRGRGPGPAVPPGQGRGLEDGSARGRGRSTGAAPAPGRERDAGRPAFEAPARGGHQGRGMDRPAPVERAPAVQSPPSRPAPEAPAAPSRGRGDDRNDDGGRGDGGRGGRR